MSFWVLTSNGEVVPRTTVQRITNLEMQVDENKARMLTFTEQLTERIGGNDNVIQDDDGNIMLNVNDWDDPAFGPEFVQEFGRTVNDSATREADQDFTPDSFDDTYLNMELALPRKGGEVQFGRVVKRLRDKNGLPIGTASDNPILDSRMYEVETDIRRRLRLKQLPRICLPRSTTRATGTSCSRKSLTIGQMESRPCNKTPL
jgi:hypothetical protein